jgi:hypothetical protein
VVVKDENCSDLKSARSLNVTDMNFTFHQFLHINYGFRFQHWLHALDHFRVTYFISHAFGTA